ncbi:MAG: methyltransferase domain-containing protein [Proteobacteria bacterium]|nr:methyltransferase domain-containing protein [Pseudomonadota bacterium]
MSDSAPNLYDQRNIDTMEIVYGTGYLSMGGDEEVARIVSPLVIKHKDVLDLGCGLGGAVVTLVRDHGAKRVQGVDIDVGLLARARELVRQAGLDDRVALTRIEPGPLPFERSSFDVVYVTAVACHVQELSPFLDEIERVLRPGGYLVGGEWFKASDNAAFVQWDNLLRERGLNFYFVSRETFKTSLADSGFINIFVMDRTKATIDNARHCLARVENELHDQLLHSMDEQQYMAFTAWTQSRLIGLAEGGMHYGHFCARKRQE